MLKLLAYSLWIFGYHRFSTRTRVNRRTAPCFDLPSKPRAEIQGARGELLSGKLASGTNSRFRSGLPVRFLRPEPGSPFIRKIVEPAMDVSRTDGNSGSPVHCGQARCRCSDGCLTLSGGRVPFGDNGSGATCVL